MKMITIMKPLVVAFGAAAILGLVSCEKKGPAEKAGEKLDDAAEKAGDKIEDATD